MLIILIYNEILVLHLKALFVKQDFGLKLALYGAVARRGVVSTPSSSKVQNFGLKFVLCQGIVSL